MTEETVSTDSVSDEAREVTEDTAAEPADDEQNEEGPSEAQDVSELPQWAQNKLTNARKEAAKYRTKAKNAYDEGFEKARSEHAEAYSQLQEQHEDTVYRLSEAELSMTRYKVALESGVEPGKVNEFAGRLQGEDEDALREDAKRLSETFGLSQPKGRQPDYSQAAGNTPLNGDPLLESVKRKLGV